MKTIKLFLTLVLAAFAILASGQKTISLSGEWQVKLDPQNKGVKEQWYNEKSFSDVLTLPGCIQE